MFQDHRPSSDLRSADRIRHVTDTCARASTCRHVIVDNPVSHKKRQVHHDANLLHFIWSFLLARPFIPATRLQCCSCIQSLLRLGLFFSSYPTSYPKHGLRLAMLLASTFRTAVPIFKTPCPQMTSHLFPNTKASLYSASRNNRSCVRLGCENDFADNLLVSPNGTEYICTTTQLEPDDTPQLSTWYVSWPKSFPEN